MPRSPVLTGCGSTLMQSNLASLSSQPTLLPKMLLEINAKLGSGVCEKKAPPCMSHNFPREAPPPKLSELRSLEPSVLAGMVPCFTRLLERADKLPTLTQRGRGGLGAGVECCRWYFFSQTPVSSSSHHHIIPWIYNANTSERNETDDWNCAGRRWKKRNYRHHIIIISSS